jgi:hypothetical protein
VRGQRINFKLLIASGSPFTDPMSRFSHLYIERGVRETDSARARRRLASWWSESSWIHVIHRKLQNELGYVFDPGATYQSAIREFFERSTIRDLLDGITIIHETMATASATDARLLSDPWKKFVTRVLEEENLRYRMDDAGVIHPFVDQEYEANQNAALEALNEQRFGEARGDFEAAYRHLRKGEGKAALRSMFPAVETAVKVLCPGAMARLMPNEVDRHFLPKLRQVYAGNQPAIDAGAHLLQGMKNWITAAQPYRHGQEVAEPAEPPPEFVVAFLSAGAVYLRWLIELFGFEASLINPMRPHWPSS